MRSAFARIGLVLSLLLMFGAAANAQIREEFVEIDGGFKVAKATEEDGTRILLVLFPDKYLVDGNSFAEGTITSLLLVAGCEPFPDCKPRYAKSEKTKDGLTIIVFDTLLPEFQFWIRALGKDGKPAGVVIELRKVSLSGKAIGS